MDLFALILRPDPATLETLNDLAQRRDGPALFALARPGDLRPGAFEFLRRGGVYGGGRSGWRVEELQDPGTDKKYAVFTTQMTCEDIGEQVFEWNNGAIGKKVDERFDFGLHLDHHEFTIRMDPLKSKVMVQDIATFRATGPSQPRFQIRLGPEWRVISITDTKAPVKFDQAAGTVSLVRPLSEDFKLKFNYEATLENPNLDGKMRADEMMLAGAAWWPSLARQASTTTTTIISPPEWRSFSHGSRVKDALENGKRVTVWENTLPISVLSAASGKYIVRAKKVGETTYWSASMDHTPAELDLQNEANAGVIGFLNSLSRWPYPAWGSLVSSRMGGGALEAYSYATYSTGWLPDIDPHETAHTFFGGVIPNTYLKSLWNESFASFFEKYYYREGVSGNRSDLRLAFMDLPFGLPAFKDQAATTASAETGASASAIGYGRGGLVLDMLEREIGETAMRDAIQTWLREHQRGRTGEWEDFEHVIMRVTKRDLRWFFNQWLRKPGFAEFEITDADRIETKDGWEATGTLRFTGSPYRLRMEALVEGAQGKVTWLKLPLTTGKTSETLRVKVPFKPTQITFDPYHRIMRSIDSASLPLNLANALQARPWVREGDEDMADSLVGKRGRSTGPILPTTLNRQVLIADPRKSPEFSALLRRIPNPPVLQGSRIVWRGQAVDIRKGGFAGVVDLGKGERCVVMFGKVRLQPQMGRANAVLFDDLGRPKAATRLPSRSGALHFDLEAPD